MALCVAEGLQGFECLSGIPGSVGATPIQNVGAYGQEVAETVESVRVFDRETGRVEDMSPAECGFVYRGSVFKYHDRRIVLSVTFRLNESALSGPLRYAELARTLDVPIGGSAPLADVRRGRARLAARQGHGHRPRRPRLRQRRLLLHQPDPRRRPRRRAGLARARRPRQDLRRVADRAGRLPQGLRQRPRRHLHQAHARARSTAAAPPPPSSWPSPTRSPPASTTASASHCTPSPSSSATTGERPLPAQGARIMLDWSVEAVAGHGLASRRACTDRRICTGHRRDRGSTTCPHAIDRVCAVAERPIP